MYYVIGRNEESENTKWMHSDSSRAQIDKTSLTTNHCLPILWTARSKWRFRQGVAAHSPVFLLSVYRIIVITDVLVGLLPLEG